MPSKRPPSSFTPGSKFGKHRILFHLQDPDTAEFWVLSECLVCGCTGTSRADSREIARIPCDCSRHKGRIDARHLRSQNLKYYLWELAKKRAGPRSGVPFSIKPSDIKIPTRCPILGIELKTTWDRTSKDEAQPILVARNPSRGFVPGNIKVISRGGLVWLQTASSKKGQHTLWRYRGWWNPEGVVQSQIRDLKSEVERLDTEKQRLADQLRKVIHAQVEFLQMNLEPEVVVPESHQEAFPIPDVLVRKGYTRVDQLLAASDKELLKVPYCGKKRLRQLRSDLKTFVDLVGEVKIPVAEL